MMFQRAFLVALIIFITIFYWLGIWYGWDDIYWWFDNLLHFLGGLWLAALFVYLLDRWQLTVLRRRFWVKLILGLGFVALIGVLWEGHEFLADWWVKEMIMQTTVADLLSDLMNDLLGGLLGLLLWHLPLILKKDDAMG